jgi:phosphoribosylamine--glycine ligase
VSGSTESDALNVLVIGGGGREHAMAWKIAQSPRVSKVYVAPGNAGTALEPELTNVALTSIPELVAFALAERVALTVVGPEAPLAAGVVDAFRNAGLRIFGPTQAAARLESSKDFAKAFMARHGIPTAQYQSFTDAVAAHDYVRARGAPIVIKADGLAAGKGVVVAATEAEAHAAIDEMLIGNRLGDAGARVVIEECLVGEEASFIVMVDGRNVLPLASSQDHKRLQDGDQGPNTGGMGAYSPAPAVTPAVHARIMREIIVPAVNGMAADGVPYGGFLYAGVMIDADGNPRTLEFNCRLGDPETQPILMRLKSDLLDLLQHAVDGTLDLDLAEWDRRAALAVVLAAAGYPGEPRQGDPIHGLDTVAPECKVFHAATALQGDVVVTRGGRVLCVTALGETVRQAQREAYDGVACIRFDGMQYRSDIGARALTPRKS